MSRSTPEISIQALRNYLIHSGWRRIPHKNSKIEVYGENTIADSGNSNLVIPTSGDFVDAQQLISIALTQISERSGLQLESLVDKISRWKSDLLKARVISGTSKLETLPLKTATHLIASLKKFLSHSAQTQVCRKPNFDRTGSVAQTYADCCGFGHTTRASFGFNIESPFLATAPLFPNEGELSPPFERQVFDRIAAGFLALKTSLVKKSADPIVENFLTGFSANICDTLAETFEAADYRKIEFDLVWSPQLPSLREKLWEPVTFNGEAYELVKKAAEQLNASQKLSDVVVEGRVTNLSSETPPLMDELDEFDHIIKMNWTRERGQRTKIKVPLSPKQYVDACDAHKAGKRIRIFGDAEKVGKFWTLSNTRDFTVLVG